MGKIKTVVTAALVATGAIGLFVDVQSQRGLRAEVFRLRAAGSDLGRARQENVNLQAELQIVAASNHETEELTRTRQRITVLKGRPEGVTDARMTPIAPLGRATPEAAHATFLAAINRGDLATLAQMMSFRDGASEEQRAAFMANFSVAIRRRYHTPEEVFAAAYFGLVAGVPPPPVNAAYRVIQTETLFPGVVQVRLWLAGADGEREDRQSFQQTPDGWAVVFRPLGSRQAADLSTLLDPDTGLPKPKQP